MIQSLLFARRIYALISREEISQLTLPNTSNTVDYESSLQYRIQT